MRGRVSYERVLRDRAKHDGRGLLTMDIVRADGSRSTLQCMISKSEEKRADKLMLRVIDWGRLK